jgi:hypothetical protein
MQELRTSALATQAPATLVRNCQAMPTPQGSFCLVPTSSLPKKNVGATEINKTDNQDNFPPPHVKVEASGF